LAFGPDGAPLDLQAQVRCATDTGFRDGEDLGQGTSRGAAASSSPGRRPDADLPTDVEARLRSELRESEQKLYMVEMASCEHQHHVQEHAGESNLEARYTQQLRAPSPQPSSQVLQRQLQLPAVVAEACRVAPGPVHSWHGPPVVPTSTQLAQSWLQTSPQQQQQQQRPARKSGPAAITQSTAALVQPPATAAPATPFQVYRPTSPGLAAQSAAAAPTVLHAREATPRQRSRALVSHVPPDTVAAAKQRSPQVQEVPAATSAPLTRSSAPLMGRYAHTATRS